MARKRPRKKLKYNKDHPRPPLGSGAKEGYLPRTIDRDIPPLVRLASPIEGTDFYKMGQCTVHHRMMTEDEGPFVGHYLSVSNPFRYPTWDEVAEARYRLVPDEVYMVMLMPPTDVYLNLHPYMFNLHQIGERVKEDESEQEV